MTFALLLYGIQLIQCIDRTTSFIRTMFNAYKLSLRLPIVCPQRQELFVQRATFLSFQLEEKAVPMIKMTLHRFRIEVYALYDLLILHWKALLHFKAS